MNTTLIDELEKTHLSEEDEFFEIDNPKAQDYIRKLESLDEEEMEEFLKRIHKHSVNELYEALDNALWKNGNPFKKK
jgi:hypothetical protein